MAEDRETRPDRKDEEAIQERLLAKGLRRTPLEDPAVDMACVVATGSDHHSARPGPGRIWFSTGF